MIYKVSITDDEGTLLNLIKVDTDMINWNSDPTRRLLGHEIIDEVERNEHNLFKAKCKRNGLDKY